MADDRRFYPRTIRARTTLIASTVVGVALVVGAFSLLAVLRQSLADNLGHIAEVRARDVAAQVDQGNLPATLAVPGSESALVQVVDPNGQVIASSGNLAGEAPISSLRPPPGNLASVDRRDLPIGEGSTFRVVALTDTAGRNTVYVAVSLDAVGTSVDTARGLLLLGTPLLLILETVVTWIIVGRALRPVETIRAEVADISALDLSHRVAEPNADDEVGRLARTMNAMLARVEHAADQQRRFVADASHELQSPIAATRIELEVGLAHPDLVEWSASAPRLLSENQRMERLVGDLLYLARNDEPGVPRRFAPVDLDDVVRDEVDRARSLTAKTLNAAPLRPALVNGRADDLGRVVRNLIDNAARYARSRIDVRLTTDDETAVLEVTDDGPGVAPADRSRVFDRFFRTEDDRSRATGGTGLGLAIVHDAVRAHGGTVTIADTPGGAHFVIRFPLAE